MLKALVVEDEPVSRDLLRAMLEELGEVDVVALAGNVAEATSAIRRHEPDVVFLDIEMPDGSGFDVIEAVGVQAMPPVVFVTAYDAYAVKAFEVMAIDYLMKPFDEVRLHESVERVRARVADEPRESPSRILALLEEFRGRGRHEYADRLAVDADTHIKLIAVADIDWLEAKGKHVLVHTRATTYSVKEGISIVAGRLDPRDFLRVHRSAVVRVDRVKEVHRWSRGTYRLVLDDGTKIVTGLTFRTAVEARLLGDRRRPPA